ncbi:hypothetical protein ACFL4T_04400 [candidate division KSB1 bacterium]
MFTKRFSLCLLLLIFSGNLYSDSNEIDKFNLLLFKFKSSNIPESALIDYNKSLKNALESTGNLQITGVEAPEDMIFDGVRKLASFRKLFLQMKTAHKISKALIGVFNYEEGLLEARYYLINIDDHNIELRRERSSVVREEELNSMYKRITHDVLADLFDNKSTHLFFSSVFFPGMGQVKAGKKTKGLVFSSAVIGALGYIYYIGSGDPYNTENKLRIETYADQTYYGFGDIYISEENYFNELEKNNRAKSSRKQASKLRSRAILFGVAVYLFNIYDIIKSTKSLDKSILDRKLLYADFNMKRNEFQVSLTVNLDRLFNKSRY